MSKLSTFGQMSQLSAKGPVKILPKKVQLQSAAKLAGERVCFTERITSEASTQPGSSQNTALKLPTINTSTFHLPNKENMLSISTPMMTPISNLSGTMSTRIETDRSPSFARDTKNSAHRKTTSMARHLKEREPELPALRSNILSQTTIVKSEVYIPTINVVSCNSGLNTERNRNDLSPTVAGTVLLDGSPRIEESPDLSESRLLTGKSQLDMNSPLRLSASKKWGKLKSVFHSIVLLKMQEAESINSIKEVSQEFDNFELRKSQKPSICVITRGDARHEALDFVRRVQRFSECAKIGSSLHIQEMKQIIREDPKRYLREVDAPDHLLNHQNSYGQTPLYVAAKNGNLEVVQFLIENKANALLKSKVAPNTNIEETAIEVAARWSHVKVMNFLLENCKYNPSIIKECAKIADSQAIRREIHTFLSPRFRKGSLVSLLRPNN